jgi:hypothetical protein
VRFLAESDLVQAKLIFRRNRCHLKWDMLGKRVALSLLLIQASFLTRPGTSEHAAVIGVPKDAGGAAQARGACIFRLHLWFAMRVRLASDRIFWLSKSRSSVTLPE